MESFVHRCQDSENPRNRA